MQESVVDQRGVDDTPGVEGDPPLCRADEVQQRSAGTRHERKLTPDARGQPARLMVRFSFTDGRQIAARANRPGRDPAAWESRLLLTGARPPDRDDAAREGGTRNDCDDAE